MGVKQTVVVTTTDVNGNAVRVKQDTAKNVIQAQTLEGTTVYVLPEAEPYDIDTTVHVDFDDVGAERSLEWATDVPDAAWRTVNIALFDGRKFVLSSAAEAIKFLEQLPPLKSPREKNNVVSFRRPESGQEAK